jgi:hypothetical protein
MTQFIGLFRGPSVRQARLMALSSDREIVELFARQLLEEESKPPGPDLRLVENEAAPGGGR